MYVYCKMYTSELVIIHRDKKALESEGNSEIQKYLLILTTLVRK